MAIHFICPCCRAGNPLSARTCGSCGKGLWALPLEERRYFLGCPETMERVPAVPGRISGGASQAEGTFELLGGTDEEPRIREEVERVSLCEVLDRVLSKGAVVLGEVLISVADIELIYLGLQVILTSVQSARELRSTPPELYAGGLG